MPFMVIYRTSDGVTRYDQSGAIDEAALFVERLRNKEGIDQIRIYRMEEIGFAFRPYYKVELGTHERASHRDEANGSDTSAASSSPATAEADEPPILPAEEPEGMVGPDVVPEAVQPLPPPPAAPVPEPAGVTGNGTSRPGLFGR